MGKKLIIIFSLLLFLSCIVGYANATSYIAIKVNGKEVSTDVSPIIINNRTMVPIRCIGEALGCNVNWDQNNNAVIIEQVKYDGNLQTYLQTWDTNSQKQVAIQNEVRALTINAKYMDRSELAIQFYMFSNEINELYNILSALTPPSNALVLHRETLKEYALWSTCYELSADGLSNNINYDLTPLSNKAYTQSEVTWNLRQSL